MFLFGSYVKGNSREDSDTFVMEIVTHGKEIT